MICAAFMLNLVFSCANSCAGRRKRLTVGEFKNIAKYLLCFILPECAEALEQMAFQLGPRLSDRFTWEEVLDCEVSAFKEEN